MELAGELMAELEDYVKKAKQQGRFPTKRRIRQMQIMALQTLGITSANGGGSGDEDED